MASLSDKLAKLRSKQKPGGAKAAETEPKAPAAAPAEAPAKPAPKSAPQPAAKPAPTKEAPKKSRLADLRAGGAKAKPLAKGRAAAEEEAKPKEEQPEAQESEFRVHTPEAAVILFGTNDIGSLWPPEYTENMAASLRRMMRDGTVPMLTSIPPANKGGHHEYWLAAVAIARGLNVPLIDYQGEVLRRRPEDWNGRLDKFAEYRKRVYDAPTLVSADGTHPSNPKQWRGDFSEEGLRHNGYTLRDYLTIRKYAEVIRKVFRREGE